MRTLKSLAILILTFLSFSPKSDAADVFCKLWLEDMGLTNEHAISLVQLQPDMIQARTLSFPMGGILGDATRTPTPLDAFRIAMLEQNFSKTLDEIKTALVPILKHNAYDGETTPISESLSVLEGAYKVPMEPSALYAELQTIIKSLPFPMGGMGGDSKREPDLKDATSIWQLMKMYNKNIKQIEQDLAPIMQYGAYDGATVKVSEALPLLKEAYATGKSTTKILQPYPSVEKLFSSRSYEDGNTKPALADIQRILRLSADTGKSFEEIKIDMTPLMGSEGMGPVKISDALSIVETAYQKHSTPQDVSDEVKKNQNLLGVKVSYDEGVVRPSWSQTLRIVAVAESRKEDLPTFMIRFNEIRNQFAPRYQGKTKTLFDQITAILAAEVPPAK